MNNDKMRETRTDWAWCFENPKEAAAEIDRLQDALSTHGQESEKDCKHESWEDRGGWNVCTDCGHGWSSDSVAVQEQEGWKIERTGNHTIKLMLKDGINWHFIKGERPNEQMGAFVYEFLNTLIAAPTLDKESK